MVNENWSYHRREREAAEKQDRKRTRRESVFFLSGETDRDGDDFFPQGNLL
jgi:hypothetical protein